MRILHISDLHIDSEKTAPGNKIPLEKLIADLKEFNEARKIDLITITGDLLNKGGGNFKIKNKYEFVEENFIEKIYKSIGLRREQVFIIPGNHDIWHKGIDDIGYNGIKSTLTSTEAVNKYIETNREKYRQGFKGGLHYNQFEKERYKSFKRKLITNFHSAFIFRYEGLDIGIGAFNSAWFCNGKETEILFGVDQIWHANDFFKKHRTSFNIGLIHHPFEFFNKDEWELCAKSLKEADINLILAGHTHKSFAEQRRASDKELVILVARSTFQNLATDSEKHKSGYQIVDFGYSEEGFIDIAVTFRKFTNNNIYDIDTYSAKKGEYVFQIKSNEKNKDFYAFLKSRYQRLTEEREKDFNNLQSSALSLLRGNNTHISEGIIKSINQNLLSVSDIKQYRRNLKFEYHITKLDEHYVSIKEFQKYEIVSSTGPLRFVITAYNEKFNARDKSDLEIKTLLINNKDYKKKIKYKEIPVADKTSNAQSIIEANASFNLPPANIYEVFREQNSTHNSRYNIVWKTDIKEIISNIEVVLITDDSLDVNIIEFGINTKFKKRTEKEKGKKINKYFYNGVLMRGDGFLIFVKN